MHEEGKIQYLSAIPLFAQGKITPWDNHIHETWSPGVS